MTVSEKDEPQKIKPSRKIEGPRLDQSECFILRAPQLYRDTYSSKPPRPGQVARVGTGELRSAREAIIAALRRGAIRLVDAREELAVVNAALEMLGKFGPGSVPVMISDEPFKIREPRKPGSKSKRKRRKR